MISWFHRLRCSSIIRTGWIPLRGSGGWVSWGAWLQSHYLSPLPSSPPRTEVLSHSWREGSAEEDLKPLSSPRRPGREEGGERKTRERGVHQHQSADAGWWAKYTPAVSPLPHCLNVVFNISQPLSSSPFPLSFISVFISTTKIPSNFFFPSLPLMLLSFKC